MKPSTRKPKPQQIAERDIIQAALTIAQLRGWRPIRMQRGSVRGKSGDFRFMVGEDGIPDHLFVKYGAVEKILWVEFKRKGETPRPNQLQWHANERARGARVVVIDSIEGAREVFA